MLLKEIEGLKFPVEFITRFFFKEKLDKKRGKVLELGSGNGNNLMLFYQYGWNVTGVDNDSALIKQANNNLSKLKNEYSLSNSFQNIHTDMINYISSFKDSAVDVLLLPHSIYYLQYDNIVEMIENFVKLKVVKKNTLVFLTVRTPEDYRYGKGKKISEKTFQLNIGETGEQGCMNTFFTEFEIINLLEKSFSINNRVILHQAYENQQNNFIIRNCDITIWGKINKLKNNI